MTDLTEMWAALETHQPIADRLGYGEEWKRMCVERTEEAAEDAAVAAIEAADVAAYAAAAAAGDAAAYAKSAIKRIIKANAEA